MFGILDYGLGNIRSVSNMLNYLNIDHIFVSKQEDFSNINKLILPGVGSFDVAMKYLTSKGFVSQIKNFIQNPKNFLFGICLGMQLLGNKSEEGNHSGLGLIDFDVKSLKYFTNYNVPHMGWSEINKQMFDFRINSFDKYYFVHSYFVPLSNNTSDFESIMICDYGFKFSAGIRKKNIYGFQFHPEKSHEFGMHLFRYLYNLK
jgi:imidazole glycerol-phosphate synthase subunit HisH